MTLVSDYLPVFYVSSFDIYFNKLSVYTNEDKTRTFLGLDVSSGYDELVTSVNIIDGCLEEFKLPKFYDVSLFLLILCVFCYTIKLVFVISCFLRT